MRKSRNEIVFMGCQPKKEKIIGYCCNIKHPGNLSVKMVKKHECLGKQCPYFKKEEDHPYWAQREQIKQLRKERKQRIYGR